MIEVKKRVAIVTAGLKPVPAIYGGGAEELTTILLEQNERYGEFDIDVYTLADSKLNHYPFQHTKLIQVKNWQNFIPIRIVFSLCNRVCHMLHIKKHYEYMAFVIPKYVKKEYDIIIVENSINIFLKLSKKYRETPRILHLHNDFDVVTMDYDKTKEHIVNAVEKATVIWAVSSYLKLHMQEIIKTDKIFVLENCIDKESYSFENKRKKYIFEWESKLKADDFVLLFCGRFDATKGILELLQAMEFLPEDQKIKLLLVGTQWFGSREEKKYEALIIRAIHNLGNRVIQCGYVEHKKMPEVYAKANLVVIPSTIAEAFGLVALEAISMGKPCVATRCGGLMDILDDTCAKLIECDEFIVHHLAQAIEELYSNKEKLRTLAQGAIVKAQQFSDKKQYYENFANLIQIALTMQ